MLRWKRMIFLVPVLFLTPGCALFLGAGVGLTAWWATEASQEETNAPVASIEDPVRLKTSPGTVHYVLYDADDDACAVAVEVSVNGGPWRKATAASGSAGTDGLSAAPAGTPHTFLWDFASDLGASEADVRMRITPRDRNDGGEADVTPVFVAGNLPPQIGTLTLPSTPVAGTAVIVYTIHDTQSDEADIQVQFQRVGNTIWTDADEDPPGSTETSTDVSTAPDPGEEHIFTWDSDAANNLPGEDASVKIRIRASDDGKNTWGNWLESADSFDVCNNTAPRVQIELMDTVQDGLVYIRYEASDTEGHTVTLLGEYQESHSGFWRRATKGPGTTPTFLAASPGGTPGLFVWDTQKDGLYKSQVTFRLTPSEKSLVGLPGTKDFLVNNNGSGDWTALPPLPGTRTGAGCAVLEGKAYVVGGKAPGGATDAVVAYDPAQRSWLACPSLPQTRENLTCATLNGKLYAVGGTVAGALSASVAVYDPETGTWSSGPPLATARRFAASVAASGRLYVIGGEGTGYANLASVEVFDPVANSWSAGPALPAARNRLAAAWIAGRIHAVGGKATGIGLTTHEFLDLSGGAWQSGAAMPTQRFGLTAEAVGGRLFVMGGNDGNPSAFPKDLVEIYDPLTDAWSTGTPMSTLRQGHCSCVLGGKILVAGGYNGNNNVDLANLHDPVSDTWRQLADLPTGRSSLACAAVGGKIYALGGRDSGSNILGANEVYDPATNTWSSRASLPVHRASFGCAARGAKIYVIGGSTPAQTYDNAVAIYDTTTNSWAPGATMTTPREGLEAALVDGKIYALGGLYQDFTWTPEVEAYDPGADSWAWATSMALTRSYFGTAVSGGRIYALAGTDGYFSVTNRVESYDPATDTWNEGLPVPSIRSGNSGASVRGRVFTFGGATGGPVNGYDPVTDTWKAYHPMPTAGSSAGVATLGDKVYLVGGSGFTRVDVFSPVQDLALMPALPSLPEGRSDAIAAIVDGRLLVAGGRTTSSPAAAGDAWTSRFRGVVPATGPFAEDPGWLSTASPGVSRRGACAVTAGGRVYVLGGFDGGGAPLDTMEVFDPAADTWSSAPSMPTARGNFGAVEAEGKIYAFGGETSSGAKTGVCEVYDLTSGAWETSVFDAMNAPRSHFGYGLEPEYGRIYAFGGERPGPVLTAWSERYDPAADQWLYVATGPTAVKGPLCLLVDRRLHLFGGEIPRAVMGTEATDRVLVFEHSANVWKTVDARLPYPATNLFGASGSVSWDHRGRTDADDFVLLGGGHDGTGPRADVFRFYIR